MSLISTSAGLLLLTAWRITRLVVADDFPPVRWARDRIVAAGPEWLGDLVTCVYCAGVWVAGGCVGGALLLGYSVPVPWLAFGGLAAAIPIVEAVVGRLEQGPPRPTTISTGGTPPTTYAGAPTTYAPSPRRGERS